MATTTGKELEAVRIFDMGSLRFQLPQKRRGLSNYFQGKSRSFACMADAKCLDDLKKEEIPEAKRKKYFDRQAVAFLPPLSCRTATSTSYCKTHVGV